MNRKIDRVYRTVHTADGRSIITPPPPKISTVCRIAVAVLSIAMLLCLPLYSQAGPEGSDESLSEEEKYSSPWCEKAGGDDSVRLWDDTEPDCVLSDRVVEFDFGEEMKPYECVGQAIHYARMTGKKPECILIQRSDISDEKFQRAVRRAQSAVISCRISLRCMNHEGKIVSCPSAMISGDFK